MSMEATLEKFLLILDTERARFLLEDLRDPTKRCPQLYNAIEKVLARHNFALSKVVVDEKHLKELEELEEAYRVSQDAEDEGYPLQ